MRVLVNDAVANSVETSHEVGVIELGECGIGSPALCYLGRRCRLAPPGHFSPRDLARRERSAVSISRHRRRLRDGFLCRDSIERIVRTATGIDRRYEGICD